MARGSYRGRILSRDEKIIKNPKISVLKGRIRREWEFYEMLWKGGLVTRGLARGVLGVGENFVRK